MRERKQQQQQQPGTRNSDDSSCRCLAAAAIDVVCRRGDILGAPLPAEFYKTLRPTLPAACATNTRVPDAGLLCNTDPCVCVCVCGDGAHAVKKL